MALGGQFDAVIDKLTDLTLADKVVWQETAAKDTFLTIVGRSVITVGVSYETQIKSGAKCFVRIHDSGKAEAEVSAPETDSENWKRIKTLLDFARRSATTQSNKVIADLLSTLEALK